MGAPRAAGAPDVARVSRRRRLLELEQNEFMDSTEAGMIPLDTCIRTTVP